MAFENVFGNVDFRLPVQAAQQQQATFLDAIGKGVAAYERGQERDLRRRQLEAKQGEFDLNNAAVNAAMKLELGQELTPQERAALDVKAKTSSPRVYTDQLGNQVVQPSGWANFAGMTGGTSFVEDRRSNTPNYAGAAGQRLGDTGYGQGTNPAMSMPYDEIQPLPMNQADVEQALQDTPIATQDNAPALDPAVAVSPFGRKAIFEQQLKDQAAQRTAGQEKRQEMTTSERRIIESGAGFKKTADAIDKAIGQVNKWTAGTGSYLANIAGTPAKNLEATLNTIKADAAFGALQTMRDNSKTGGALGQVSERELALLESAQAPLDQAQTPEQLIESLENYKRMRMEALQRVSDAFEQDYGYRPKQIDDLIKKSMPKQESSSFSEGQTATNPQTGEKMIFRGGSWQMM